MVEFLTLPRPRGAGQHWEIYIAATPLHPSSTSLPPAPEVRDGDTRRRARDPLAGGRAYTGAADTAGKSLDYCLSPEPLQLEDLGDQLLSDALPQLRHLGG